MARRILALWLPRLPTDAWARRHGGSHNGNHEEGDHPLVAIMAERGRLTVTALNRAAEGAGLLPGMPLADARAIEPVRPGPV